MKKLLFIVNNRAGKTRSRSPLYDAIACFSRSGYLVSVHETQGPGDATQTVHDHGAQFDLIVCAGGDGTLNETITGLMTLEERPPLGYLPNGSTNDFAASLHIPANLVEAALIASDGTPTPLDGHARHEAEIQQPAPAQSAEKQPRDPRALAGAELIQRP